MPERRHCVLIDTNIWRSTLLLRAGLGPALLHIIHRSGGRIGLPEVVESEIRKQLLIAGEEAVESVERGFRELRALLGRHRPYSVPSAENIEAAIDTRLSELESLLERVGITIKDVRSALHRVNAGAPPNSPKNQQFKDSMIWEAALKLGRRFEVHLVSHDSGFYLDRNFNAPAPELAEEAESMGRRVLFHPELQDCLQALRGAAADVDTAEIARAAFERIKSEVDKDAKRLAIRVGAPFSHEIQSFVTEQHDVLALSYRIVCDGLEDGTDQRDEIRVIVEGEGRYSLSQQSMIDIRLDRVDYEWTDQVGQRGTSKSVYAHVGTLYLGAGPDVVHSIRVPLP